MMPEGAVLLSRARRRRPTARPYESPQTLQVTSDAAGTRRCRRHTLQARHATETADATGARRYRHAASIAAPAPRAAVSDPGSLRAIGATWCATCARP